MVERFNRTILNSLSLLVSNNQQDWDKKLPFFLLAYRSAVHDTTGYSPSQMLFGRDLRLPADLLFSRSPDAPLVPEEYIEKLQARMEEMHHLARKRIGMASEKMKTRYDARATGHDFHEGDKVWLWNPKRRKGLSPKLQTNWEGPYTVLKRLNDVMVWMQKSPHSKNRRQFSGGIKDWLHFWSRFQNIHDDDEIAPENKFQYLVQATVNGSRAREVVESFPATAANYAKAVDSLKTRFGRDDLLVEVYARELLKLIISVQKQEKISMTSLYDKLESYLRALKTLGVTTEKCASILYPMVESCFQEYFLKAWNRNATSAASTDAKERLTNLMTFLKAKTEGEERINLAMAGFGLGVDENRQSFKKKSKRFFE
ncbi:uncharacterized protein TNCV_605911 [Trichonephila clavipes]|nr:uncharacterized protein TNCV_605911 [Trichonephila clavipes]